MGHKFIKVAGEEIGRDNFKAAFGAVLHEELRDMLHIDSLAGEDLTSSTSINLGNPKQIVIVQNFTTRENEKIAIARFTINTQEKSIYIDNLDCFKPANGFATQFTMNLVNLASKLGYQTITSDCTKVGSYSHARSGFEPTMEDWQSLKISIAGKLTKLEDVDILTKKAVNAALSSYDPKSIWLIADSIIGKDLLLYNPWSGHLDFSSPEAMARARGEHKKVNPDAKTIQTELPTLNAQKYLAASPQCLAGRGLE